VLIKATQQYQNGDRGDCGNDNDEVDDGFDRGNEGQNGDEELILIMITVRNSNLGSQNLWSQSVMYIFLQSFLNEKKV